MNDPYYGPPQTQPQQPWLQPSQQPWPPPQQWSQWPQPSAVDLEVERLRGEARRVLRTRVLWRSIAAAVMVVAVVVVLGSFADEARTDTSRTHDYIVWVLLALLLSVLIVVAAVGFSRKRVPRRVSPLWGLPAASRKQVIADIRAGRPSADPVLRAVEQQLVDDYRSSAAICYWLQGSMVLFLGFLGIDAIRLGSWSGLSYLVAAAAFLSVLIASIRIGLGSRGFPRS